MSTEKKEIVKSFSVEKVENGFLLVENYKESETAWETLTRKTFVHSLSGIFHALTKIFGELTQWEKQEIVTSFLWKADEAQNMTTSPDDHLKKLIADKVAEAMAARAKDEESKQTESYPL